VLAYFHRFSVFDRTGKKDANTLRVGRIFYFILFYFFFENGEKKSQFSKISGYCGRGQKPHSNRTAAKKEYMKMQTLVVEQSWAGGGRGLLWG